MDWDRIERKLEQLPGHAREKWGKIADDDLEKIGGRRDQLVGRIQERYGIARDEAQKQADEWAKALKRRRKGFYGEKQVIPAIPAAPAEMHAWAFSASDSHLTPAPVLEKAAREFRYRSCSQHRSAVDLPEQGLKIGASNTKPAPVVFPASSIPWQETVTKKSGRANFSAGIDPSRK